LLQVSLRLWQFVIPIQLVTLLLWLMLAPSIASEEGTLYTCIKLPSVVSEEGTP
jgi:hypothetical protein